MTILQGLSLQEGKGERRRELAVDQREQEEWIARARKSDCARSIDNLFKEEPRQVIEELKDEIFKQIYMTMGEELEPEDIERAVVVHHQKFNCYMVFFLTLFTLGLFCLFRPRDDDTVLVMTKKDGRVFMHKVERTNFCAGGNSDALLMFLRYMVTFFTILATPSVLYVLLWDATHANEENLAEWLILERQHIIRMLQGKERQAVWFYGIGLVCIAFFLYISIPRGAHGTRHHQNHAATNLAVGQFTLSRGNFRRRHVLRLFFGRYPSQSVLDTVGTWGLGHIAGPVPVAELGLARWTSPTIITFLTLALSGLTLLDTSLNWVDRSVLTGHAAYVTQFCYQADAKDFCTKSICSDWAAKKNTTNEFCEGIGWYDDVSAALDNWVCWHQNGPPCCAGCSKGTLTDGGVSSSLRGALSFFGDIGTIVFSLMAARIALEWTKLRGHVEVVIERRHILRKPTANVDLIRPLMQLFLESVSSKAAERAPAGEFVAPAREPLSGREKATGVRNFEISDDNIGDWNVFLKESKLTKPSDHLQPWTLSVNVPRKCLGIHDNENIVAAWGELPAQLWTGGLWPVLAGYLGWIQHAVVLTDRRVFYVRVIQRFPWLLLLRMDLGRDVRVDVFRHDREIFFGNLKHHARPIFYRAIKAQWRPGMVFMQVRFGVLGMSRDHGNALSVYNMVSQIAKSTHSISKKDLEDSRIKWKDCEDSVSGALTKRHGGVWALRRQPDDLEALDPEIYLADEKEMPIFHWGFKERGRWFSYFHNNTDIVVTTGRIYIWTRGFYKDYDCRTCFCWTCCWCACVYKFLRDEFLLLENAPSSLTFMTMPSILSFSTETRVEPAICCDPIHPPWRCPAWEECCSACTRWLTCQSLLPICFPGRCCGLPGRTGPRTQLFMTWRLKQRVQDEDLEVVTSLRPCALPDFDDEELGGFNPQNYSKGYVSMNEFGELPEEEAPAYEEQARRVKMLWRITGVALRAFDRVEAQPL